MRLFYVMGGGAGHLTRVRVFIDQFQLEDVKILTNNSLAKHFFSANEVVNIPGNTPELIQAQVDWNLTNLHYDTLYLDTFPFGLFGEVKSVKRCRMIYLARRIRWEAYKQYVGNSSMHFDHVYYFEELEDQHKEFVETNSTNSSFISLQFPDPKPERIPQEMIPARKLLWIIVHSFIQEEVELLLDYAMSIAQNENQHPTFIVLTDQPVKHNDALIYPYFPARDWFPLADRIFIAGGFNLLHEVALWCEKVTTIPMPRTFDDQAWRVKQFNSNTIKGNVK